MDYETCYQAAIDLLELSEKEPRDRNEAQTRFDLVDHFLKYCMGWDHLEIKVENPNGPDYTDYELGTPRKMIYEAKRQSKHFEIPAGNHKHIHSLKQIKKLSKTNEEALKQVQEYCANRGVTYAAITNGEQVIAFVGSRQDGIEPLDGKCFVISSLNQLIKDFPLVHSLLSKVAIEENRLMTYLNSGGSVSTPTKLSSSLPTYPDLKERSDFQASLKIISDIILEDVLGDKSVEKTFYEQCYCEAGALSQYSLLSKKILSYRYAALFSPGDSNPTLQPVKGDRKKISKLSDEVVALTTSKRPIVLIGDVGVGKTSFIKNLINVSAKEEFENALFIYIDLGRQANFYDNIRDFVIDETEAQLHDKHEVDLYESSFIFGVYHSEVARFRRGLDGDLEETDPPAYKRALKEHLREKTKNKPEHLRRSIDHISKARHKQVVIAIDNADQRSLSVQQEAFVISEEIASGWGAVVFITVRPHTFYQSKRSGALAAYPTKAFTISPPRIDLVLEKRLGFALSMASGKTPIEQLRSSRLGMSSLAHFLEAILFTLNQTDELITLIDNISNGNVRTAVELIVNYIGSANADSERIIKEMILGEKYKIPVHDFAKTIIYGEYVTYYPERSMAFNLFDVSAADSREHFLASIIISLLDNADTLKSAEGFVRTDALFDKVQGLGFSRSQIEIKLRKLTNKKLIEASERITFEEDITGLIGQMPDSFRVTATGIYHIQYWSADFAYLDAMLFDTPIFDREVRQEIAGAIRNTDLSVRFNRAGKFRDYLTAIWRNSNIKSEYYSWEESVSLCSGSFEKVQYFFEKKETARKGFGK
jgi:GTPase SAR1 family protein